MPRSGENPLARFAHAIAHEEGFSFGTARLSEDGSLVEVPVLGTAVRARSYVLAAEVSDSVSAVDVGRIDRLQVRNDSGVRVFLPPGALFEGRGTSSRGTCAGVVLDPHSARDIDAKCVQAARSIREGAELRLAQGLAPHPTTQALLSRDQGLVWATVGASTLASDGSRSRGPDVASNSAACGAVLLDADGVLAVEICDHPDSWRAVSRSSMPSRDPTARLALNPAGAVRIAKEFLERLAQRSCHAATPESWVAVGASAACTTVDGQVVHLVALGRDLTGRATGPMAEGEPTAAPSAVPMASLAVSTVGAAASDDSDVAVAEVAMAEPSEGAGAPPVTLRPRRRKVLTSGWDGATFESLERCSRKEFRGDRSAAIRYLVRHELRRRGYMGPRPLPQDPAVSALAEAEEPSPRVELGRAGLEARVRDLERIAETDAYADWLRKRARLELERMATAAPEEALRSAAQSALDRLPVDAPVDETLEPEEIMTEAPPAPPPPPPVDVRPLLRRAFAASAGGRYPDALSLFDEVLLAEPENRTALLGRAVALRRSGKAQEALGALDLVLRVEPSNAAALLSRGRILQERGDLPGALQTLDRLAEVAPNDWDVWMARGDVLARMGRTPEALQAFSEALRRNPDDEGIQTRIRGLETARTAPPAAVPRVPLPRDLQEGQSYLVKEGRPDLSFRILRALLVRAVPSLLITRQPPERVRREAGLAGTRILELSHAPGEGRHDPTALVGLTQAVQHFVRENHGRGVVLLDGVASLVQENGSRETILFIERVHETILPSRAIFLVSLAPRDLGEREAALLERSLRVLT